MTTRFTIRNTNEAYGEPMEFSGETLEAAVNQMQTAVRNCGPEFSNVIVTSDDYQVCDTQQTQSRSVFANAYLDCLLWQSTDETGEPLDGLYTQDDISDEAVAEALDDCNDFWAAWSHLISDRPEKAGQDFCLTRNRHGAGFWDGGWPEGIDRELTEASRAYGSQQLYAGDDGLLYAY